MLLDTIRTSLERNRALLSAYHVAALHVFGSSARGTDRPDSDVDILVDFSEPVGLIAFVGLKLKLESLLGRRVDLVTRAALKPQLRDQILREAVRAA